MAGQIDCMTRSANTQNRKVHSNKRQKQHQLHEHTRSSSELRKVLMVAHFDGISPILIGCPRPGSAQYTRLLLMEM